jgi:uncharacterized RDD family membrane protein YckC
MAESKAEMGPYYAPADYAGLFRRFAILFVDGFVAFIALGIIGVALNDPGDRSITPAQLSSFAVFCWLYFVVLETYAGTLGFLVTRVRIVTLKGERPGLFRMTFRFLIWILGPINALVDFIWLTGDDYKQTLRDKIAGTLVIRKDAVPAGTGEIRLNRYQLLGHSFVFYEVKKP